MEKIGKRVTYNSRDNIICKDGSSYVGSNSVETEYHNILLLNSEKKSKISSAIPIKLDKKNNKLYLKYINGENLKLLFNPEIFKKFGSELKILHTKDKITHGELEVQDVIYNHPMFYLVDLPQLNSKLPLEDYSRFKLSIYVHQLKNPLNWRKYNELAQSFTIGYKPSKKSNYYLNRELDKTINYYFKRSFKFKLRGLILYLFLKLKFRNMY